MGTLGCSQRDPANDLVSLLPTTASLWHNRALVKDDVAYQILFLGLLWALWVAHRETLQISLCLGSLQQPACGTMVPWSKMKQTFIISFLCLLWALWAAHRGTPQVTWCLGSSQQPACGTMVPWSKMNWPIKNFVS